MKNHKAVLLLCDKLADFTCRFEHKNIHERFTETGAAETVWRKQFIVFPNRIYSNGEGAFYNPVRGLTKK